MADASKFIVIAVAGQSNSVGYDESVWTEANKNDKPEVIKQLGYHTVDGVDQNLKVIPLDVCAHNLQNMSNISDPKSNPQSLGTEGKGTKGIHLPLAKILYENLTDEIKAQGYGILMVPVAFGGTKLGDGPLLTYNSDLKRPEPVKVGKIMTPGGGTWQVPGAYYQTLRDRVIYALDLNPENKFAGVIWCQGEFDAYKAADIAKNIEQFPILVDKLSEDWNAATDKQGKKLSERTIKGTFDRSLWVVHESSCYWRNATVNGVDCDEIWANYKKVLGESNYVAVPSNIWDTNQFNGATTAARRTSSLLPSHFGNDAFSRVVAPLVANTLLRNKMIYGQKDSTLGVGTSDTGKYTKYLKSFNAASNSFEVNNDNGNIKYLKTLDYGKGKLGPMTSIVFDPKVNSIELSNIVGGAILILEYTDSGDYTGLIFNASNKPSSNSNFTTVRSKGNTNLATTGGADVMSWGGFQYANGLTVSAYDFAKGKVQITRTPEGKYVFTKGDNREAWFEYDIKNNDSSLVKNGVAADQIKYGFGLGYGWAAAFANDTTVANILAVTEEQAAQPEKKVKVVKFNANGGEGTMEDVEVDLSNGNADFTVPASTFTAPAGKQFKTWSEAADNETKVHAVNDVLNFGNPGEFTLYAIYEDAPAATNSITVDPAQVDLSATGKAELSITTTGKKAQELALVAKGADDKITVTFRDFNEYTAKADVAVKEGVADSFNVQFTIQSGGGSVVSNSITAVRTVTPTQPEQPNAIKKIVKFAAGEGTGSMADVEVVIADTATGQKYTIPASTFVAPTGKQFKNWLGSDKKEYAVGAEIIFGAAGEFTFTAQYEAASGGEVTPPAPGDANSITVDPASVDFTNTKEVELNITTTGKKAADLSLKAVGGEHAFTVAFKDFNEYTAKAVVTLKADYVGTLDTTFTVQSGGGSVISNVISVTRSLAEVKYKTINYHANGGSGSMPSDEVAVGESFEVPYSEFTAPEGKQFKIWSTAADKEETTYRPAQHVEIGKEGVLDFYAIWEDAKEPAPEENSKTVHFAAGEGSGTMEDVVVPLGQYVVPASKFTDPDGKYFTNWLDEATGISYAVEQVITFGIPGEITFTAQYVEGKKPLEPDAEHKLVHFDANGGEGEMESVLVPFGAYTIPASTFKAPEGKEFKGWSEAAGEALNLKQPGDTIEFGKTGEFTFYAYYEDIVPLTYDEVKTALNDANTSIKEKLELILLKGNAEQRNLVANLEDYRVAMTTSISGLIDDEQGAANNFTLFNTIFEVINIEDQDRFQTNFDLINFMFLTYAKKGDAFYWAALTRFDDKWTYGTRSLKTYTNLSYIINTLADITTRQQNIKDVDFEKALDPDQTLINETAKRNIMNYYS